MKLFEKITLSAATSLLELQLPQFTAAPLSYQVASLNEARAMKTHTPKTHTHILSACRL